jgi:hypothetical protein
MARNMRAPCLTSRAAKINVHEEQKFERRSTCHGRFVRHRRNLYRSLAAMTERQPRDLSCEVFYKPAHSIGAGYYDFFP